jgi:hypothetical protein
MKIALLALILLSSVSSFAQPIRTKEEFMSWNVRPKFYTNKELEIRELSPVTVMNNITRDYSVIFTDSVVLWPYQSLWVATPKVIYRWSYVTNGVYFDSFSVASHVDTTSAKSITTEEYETRFEYFEGTYIRDLRYIRKSRSEKDYIPTWRASFINYKVLTYRRVKYTSLKSKK